MSGCMALEAAGETLLLHPDRAVLWPARRTVIVADTHFGKSGVFRRHGLAVPAGSDDHDRRRLSDLIEGAQARRLIVLGDFLHAPLEPDGEDARDLQAWAAALAIDLRIIAGNHDRGAALQWTSPVHWHEADLVEAPFRFTHDASRGCARGGTLFTLSGHIHPVVRLGGLRRRGPRVPVFWQREGGLVLPAFGLFTGGHLVAPGGADRIFALGPQRVVRFQ